MEIIRKNVGIYGSNTYIFIKDENAIIIDCGGDADLIYNIIQEKGVKVKAIFLTHGHLDHITGVPELRILTNAPVYGPELEKDLFFDAEKNLSKTSYSGPVTIECDYYFNHMDEISIGDFNIKTFHTPGHTEGSFILLINNELFTGDTLFNMSVGRTDLYSGDQVKLENSLEFIKSNFDPATRIYPGHGRESTLKFEIENNPYLK